MSFFYYFNKDEASKKLSQLEAVFLELESIPESSAQKKVYIYAVWPVQPMYTDVLCDECIMGGVEEILDELSDEDRAISIEQLEETCAKCIGYSKLEFIDEEVSPYMMEYLEFGEPLEQGIKSFSNEYLDKQYFCQENNINLCRKKFNNKEETDV